MKRSAILLIGLLAAGFVSGLVHLFHLRFEAGDVYPPYSSLRADPLGTKALFESLEHLMPARRNFEPLSKLGDGRETTLFYLGASRPEELRFSPDEFRDVETFVRSGGRIVFAFHPQYLSQRPNRFGTPGTPGAPPPKPAPPNSGSPTNTPPGFPPASVSWEPDAVPLGTRWEFQVAYAPLERSKDGSFTPALAEPRITETHAALPERLRVHTALYFDVTNPDWTVVYSRRQDTNDYPVVIQRTLGGGTIVLVADSYPFSNEALRRERHPGLLTWFLGGNQALVVDETHLGTRTDPGIASLARRYRLHGLAAALVVLAGLFIWKNSFSFLPPDDAELSVETSHQIAGKDSTEGFINLLRRNVAPATILKVCLDQWNAQATGSRKPARWKLEAMQKLIDEQNALEPRRRDPVRTYQQFCEILAKRT